MPRRARTSIEYTDMLLIYGEVRCNAAAAKRLYAQRYPDRNIPSERSFVRLVQKSRESIASIINCESINAGAPTTCRTACMEEEILLHVSENPTTSTRAISSCIDMSHTTVHRLLQKEELYPYHSQRVQYLHPTDFGPRINFCKWFLERYQEEPRFPRHILFTDEASFTREGVWNCHNSHTWADENPHIIRLHAHQRKFNVNIWAGILNGQLIGPYILPPHLTGQNYLTFLRTVLPELLEDVSLYTRQQMWFQHDGAPAHFHVIVRNYLTGTMGNRWIGRGGPVAWPPRSPDLTPMDFSIWGIMKNFVYTTPVESEEDLVARIVIAADELRAIPGIFDNIYEDMLRRCNMCIEAGGQQFEHLK